MKTKRTVATVFAVLLVFVLLFSHLLILAEADHDCSGEDCPVCQILTIAEETLKGLSLLLCLIALFTLQKPIVKSARSAFAGNLLSSTPILLKVKLTN